MNWKPQAETWKTLMVIVAGMVGLRFVFHTEVFLYIAGGIGLLSFLIPAFGVLLVFLWGKLGHVLGWINSKWILGAVFFFTLVPIALLARITGRDKLKLKKQKDSVYTVRDHTYKKDDLGKAW